MDISIITEYSYWWILPFAIISFLFVYWQYFYKKPYHRDLSQVKIRALASLRWLSYLLLFILLLGPRVKFTSKKINKPLLVFAQDNSKSLRYSSDSTYYLMQYPNKLEEFLEKAATKYDVQKIGFGNESNQLEKLDFSSSATDLSNLVRFLKTNYGYEENLQIVLASDGLYNKGGNPRYQVQDISFPIHTIQLGDTSQIDDVSIQSVKTNQIGFVNTKLPVRIGIKANNFENATVNLKIRTDSKLLISDEFRVGNSSFYVEKDYLINPEKAGLQKFKVEISSNRKEYSLKNNLSEVVVDILDTKRKIAICFEQFHPDIAAIKSAIDENLNFSSELVNLSKQSPDLEDVNLLVLYQVPSGRKSYLSLLQQAKQKEIPLLMILGPNSDLQRINAVDLGVSISNSDDLFQDAIYSGNDNFSLFELASTTQKSIEKLPPLLSPFGDYNFSTEHQVLAYQKIKSIETPYPLIAFTNNNNQKIAWIFGEGIWRWKLHSFRLSDSHKDFNELVNRFIQYLALKVKRDQLVIRHAKNYSDDDIIEIEAELYNKSYQLINKPELEFVLKNDKGNSFNYKFEKNALAYQLIITSLPKGNYKYEVKAVGYEQDLKREGEFFVSASNLEAKNLQADRNLLAQISKQTGGLSFEKDNFSGLLEHLLDDNQSKPSISEEIKYGNVTNLTFVLIFIIILMVLEWFLRKYWLSI